MKNGGATIPAAFDARNRSKDCFVNASFANCVESTWQNFCKNTIIVKDEIH